MDFPPVMAQVSVVLSWLILATLLLGLLKLAWAKWHIGERLVRFAAHRQLDEPAYYRLHSVTLYTPDDVPPIDHVFLSIYGIFVLKTKNISGWTFKTEVPVKVTQGIGFISYIKSFQQAAFSEAEVDVMQQALQTSHHTLTFATHREHEHNLSSEVIRQQSDRARSVGVRS